MNILEKAMPENSFRCADGSVLSSVYELENKLCAMSSEAFHNHVNSYRNDFHNWIRDIFRDYELANELLRAKTPAAAAVVVRKHLRKALLAKEEIENAIKKVSTAESKLVRTAGAISLKKKKPKKRKKPKKAAATAKATKKKNRKLNKKHNKKRLNKVAAKKRKTKERGSRNKRKSGSAHKLIKKQVNRWLNWLKIVPEL